MLDLLTLVLGGGRGQRLYPLTKFRSKPAVPLGGKYRIIDIPVSNCLNSDINRVFVLTQFNSASLNKHIVQTYKFDMFNGGFVDILAAEQTPDNPNWFQGTADAVRQNIKHFAPFDVGYVLVVSGDQLYQMDFREVFRYHVEKKADVTVACTRVTAAETSALGIMKVDDSGRITAFFEKPGPERLPELASRGQLSGAQDGGRDYLANMGIYLFHKDLLIDFLATSSALDFGKDLIPEAVGKCKVFAYAFDGYWTDIGTIRSFYEANLALTEPRPRFSFYDAQRPIYTHPRNLPSSKLNNCTLRQTMVADGCILNGADITRSIVGIRSRIGKGTRIKDSILMGADWFETIEAREANAAAGVPSIAIGSNCTIADAIIDKNVRVGDYVSIINVHGLREMDGENFYIREGIVIIPKGASLASGTTI